MTTQISGTTGVSKVQDGVVVQADLAANVVGNGPAFATAFTGTSVIAAGATEMTLNSKTFDTASALSTTTGRFTPTVAGYYQFNAYLFVGNLGGAGVFISKNNNPFVQQAYGVADTTAYKHGSVSGLAYLNGTTDYVSVFCYAASGGATVTGHFSGFLARAA